MAERFFANHLSRRCVSTYDVISSPAKHLYNTRFQAKNDIGRVFDRSLTSFMMTCSSYAHNVIIKYTGRAITVSRLVYHIGFHEVSHGRRVASPHFSPRILMRGQRCGRRAPALKDGGYNTASPSDALYQRLWRRSVPPIVGSNSSKRPKNALQNPNTPGSHRLMAGI
jgi:hypothetical protein